MLFSVRMRDYYNITQNDIRIAHMPFLTQVLLHQLIATLYDVNPYVQSSFALRTGAALLDAPNSY